MITLIKDCTGFILLLITLTLVGSTQGHALEFMNYKDTVEVTDMSEKALGELWTKTPVCIKDGGKIRAVNKLFKAEKLGYSDCSNSAKIARKHSKLGISVAVIPLYSLPSHIVKKLSNRKVKTK